MKIMHFAIQPLYHCLAFWVNLKYFQENPTQFGGGRVSIFFASKFHFRFNAFRRLKTDLTRLGSS
jgi:hypothetical protein